MQLKALLFASSIVLAAHALDTRATPTVVTKTYTYTATNYYDTVVPQSPYYTTATSVEYWTVTSTFTVTPTPKA